MNFIGQMVKMHIKMEANKSNRIEGTQTSIEEELMPITELSPEKRNDAREVHNYINALQLSVDRIMKDDFPLSSRLIKEIHYELMKGVRGENKTPGEYRTSQNWIGGSLPSNAVYVPPTHVHVQELISDMENSTIPTKHITLQGNVSGISNLCVQLLSGFETALSSTYNDDESVYQVNSFCTYFRSFGESDGYERAFSLTYEDALQLLPKDKEDYNYSIKRFSIPKEEKLRLMEIVKDKNSAVSIKAVIDYGFKEVEKVFKSSRDAGEYEDKTGIVAKPIKVNPNGYNEDKKPVFSSKEIDDFIKGAIKDMNNLMTQEAHSTEDKKVSVMDDSVDDEKDKPISTPEEFINYVEGLFEI